MLTPEAPRLDKLVIGSILDIIREPIEAIELVELIDREPVMRLIAIGLNIPKPDIAKLLTIELIPVKLVELVPLKGSVPDWYLTPIEST